MCLIKGPYGTSFLSRRSFRWNVSHSLGSLCPFSTSAAPIVWSQVRQVRAGLNQTCSQGLLNHVFYSLWSFPSALILFSSNQVHISSDEGKLSSEKSKPRFYGSESQVVEIISIQPRAPELQELQLAYISGHLLRIVAKFRDDPDEERLQCTVTVHVGEES